MFVVHRIKCLSSNDRAALNACNKALSINPNVTALKNKKKSLNNIFNPKPKIQPAPKIAKAPIRQPVRPKKDIVRKTPTPIKPQITRKLQRVPIKTVVLKKPDPKVKTNTQKSNRKIVMQIQKSLNQLGLGVGQADGVVGKNTRQAINNFQRLMKSKTSFKIDKNLQTALLDAVNNHTITDSKYILAKQYLNNGNLEKASLIINKQLKSTPWHKDLIDLNIEYKKIISLNKKSEETNKKLAKAKLVKDLETKAQNKVETELKNSETRRLVELAKTNSIIKKLKVLFQQ